MSNSTRSDDSSQLSRTPLHELHIAAGAKMVPFAGYEMPVQYPMGVLKEHLWTREKAGLFDVSHMGQAYVVAADKRHETAAAFLEQLVPADILGLAPEQQRYTQLLNHGGGIIDDLMVTRLSDETDPSVLFLVLNAARKAVDLARLQDLARDRKGVIVMPNKSRALIALQGPAAADVLSRVAVSSDKLAFMQGARMTVAGIEAHVSRSGYTGEDGFEISVHESDAAQLWTKLSSDERVKPIGLGARDSLRLEAGLCLYGHDIDETTSPVEANLQWSIQKRRRTDGGFPGASRIQSELLQGAERKRVGIKPEGRAPAREGTEIVSSTGDRIGIVTSGGFGPSVNGPIAMGYVPPDHAKPGTTVQLVVRGKEMPAQVVALPFVTHRFHRKTS